MNDPWSAEKKAHVQKMVFVPLISVLVLSLVAIGIWYCVTTPKGETTTTNGITTTKVDKVKLIPNNEIDWPQEIQASESVPQIGDQLFMVEDCVCTNLVRQIRHYNKEITIKTGKEETGYYYIEYTKKKKWTHKTVIELPVNSEINDFLYIHK